MDNEAQGGSMPEHADDSEAPAPVAYPHRIVGIAASAGGLEAVSLLVQNLPAAMNAIYVIAQHMSPTHKSLLSTLISRETSLPVTELAQETVPEPDTIYVTPPNTDVVFEHGMLRLRNPSGHPASPKPSADRLFKSLAESYGEACVGIVLSGTGSDGSYGVQAIREEGGITIAQDPASAKYDGMPTSAIETGCVDLTLSPEQIGQHLEKILERPRNLDVLRSLSDQPNRLGELFGILLARTQVDFADYKENMLNRRIARRMSALGIDDYDNYVSYCRTNVDEVDALHRDLLISVTRFFRDPLQFERLRTELIQSLAPRVEGPIRIWVVGCATGEEAYSIAILVADILGGLAMLNKNRVQVFATDIDHNAVEVARKGVYPITAAQDIPEEYLREYFTIGSEELTVRPELRSVTLFSRHNAFQDPPFINVDLVCIRNVLIYFNLALQERVLSRLHYSMAAGGLLFLGTSETVGEMSIYFESRDGAEKIFSKRRGISGELSIEPGGRVFFQNRSTAPRRNVTPPAVDSAAQAEMSIAKAVAPNGMICTRDGSIIEVIGELGAYFDIRTGVSTSLNVKMLIEPLRSEATSLIAVALRSSQRRDGRWHNVSLPAGNRVQLQAFPFNSHRGGETICLVAINTKFEKQTDIPLTEISNKEQRAYVERMENEIRSTQEALQQTIEELQTSNEELQSANEELQSTNEEFQATNEELETSNEELQSTNEELLTVNEELQITSAERQALASELEASLVSSPYVFALADQALMVRRMSKVAMTFFGQEDLPPTGVHLSQFTLPAGFPALAPVGNSVLQLQEPKRLSVLSDGRYYNLVLSPVFDVHRKLIGLSITVTHHEGEPLSQILEMLSSTTHVAYWAYHVDTGELYLSPEIFRLLGLEPCGEMLSIEEFQSRVHPDDRRTVSEALQGLVKHGGETEAERRMIHADGHVIRVHSRAMALRDAGGRTNQVIGVMNNRSSAIERDILLSNFEAANADLGIGYFSFDIANDLPHWHESLFRLLGYDPKAYAPTNENWLEIIHPEDREMVTRLLEAARLRGESFRHEARILRQDGSVIWCAGSGSVRVGRKGQPTHVFGRLRKIDGPTGTGQAGE